jgi:hypothetical protein
MPHLFVLALPLAGWHNKDARELPNYHTDQLGMTETYWDARLTPEGEMQAGLISVRERGSECPSLAASGGRERVRPYSLTHWSVRLTPEGETQAGLVSECNKG